VKEVFPLGLNLMLNFKNGRDKLSETSGSSPEGPSFTQGRPSTPLIHLNTLKAGVIVLPLSYS
jgi:hypothetical protein